VRTHAFPDNGRQQSVWPRSGYLARAGRARRRDALPQPSARRRDASATSEPSRSARHPRERRTRGRTHRGRPLLRRAPKRRSRCPPARHQRPRARHSRPRAQHQRPPLHHISRSAAARPVILVADEADARGDDEARGRTVDECAPDATSAMGGARRFCIRPQRHRTGRRTQQRTPYPGQPL